MIVSCSADPPLPSAPDPDMKRARRHSREGIWVASLVVMMFVRGGQLYSQQVPDSAFAPPIAQPAYPPGTGPSVLIDEAHANFHTAAGRYLPFASLLRRDGYQVGSFAETLSGETLRAADVLVIANARAPEALRPGEVVRPRFSNEEVIAVRQWVCSGGALFLIMDHSPFDGAAVIAREFGIRLRSGAARSPANPGGRLAFRRENGTLADHSLTAGIAQVATFTGTSFELERGGEPLLILGPGIFSYSAAGDSVSVAGHLQGAVLTVGQGKVAVFGEAAMFSAQLSGPDRNPMGMNAAIGRENPQLLRNLMRWLSSRP